MPQANIPLLGEMGPISSVNSDDSDITNGTLKGVGVPYPYYLNGIFEIVKGKPSDDQRKIAFSKRPGLGSLGVVLSSTYNGYKIQGLTTSLDKSRILFYLNNGTVNRTGYYDGTTLTISVGNAPAAAGNWTFTNPVVWTVLDGISYGANVFYAVTDFTKGAVVNATGTWTEITDADFTGLTKVTNFVGMGGYLFIGTSNNRIYNSDLNSATAWTATSFITASDTPGNLVWLGRIRNYLVAFKQYSLEFYEDTGNPTPGSPLTVQRTLRKPIGLASKSSVQYVSDGIIFMGQSDTSYVRMYKLRYDDLGLEEISDYSMNNLINARNTYSASTSYSVDPVSNSLGIPLGESRIISLNGKEFYLIDVTSMGTATRRTYVYDNELKVWVTWNTWFKTTRTSTTGAFDVYQGFTFSYTSGGLYGTTYTVLVNNYTAVNSNVPPAFLAFSTTKFGSVCQDSDGVGTVSMPFAWIGDIQDFGTRKRKFMDTLEFLLEAETGAATTSETLTVYYRDADFNDSSAGTSVTRTASFDLDMSTRAIVRRLGSFRKRQVGVLSTTATYLRLLGVQTQLNIGETDQEG